jgi:hypothetical protein
MAWATDLSAECREHATRLLGFCCRVDDGIFNYVDRRGPGEIRRE